MGIDDMARIMELVQWGEGATGLYDKSEALDVLCGEVRAFVEQEAELCGMYTELMERIGEEG